MGSGERRCATLTLFRYLTSVNVTSTILVCIWSIRMRHAMRSFLFNNYSNVIKTRYLHENKKNEIQNDTHTLTTKKQQNRIGTFFSSMSQTSLQMFYNVLCAL